ncbi:MAG: extracellular solute-binding protein [Rhodospirillales bacterium]|jgi:lactose/L-arabinose transport system substrate-binding protein
MTERTIRRRTVIAAGAAGAATAWLAGRAPAYAQGRTTKITYWCWSEHARGANAVYPKFREANPDVEVEIINLNPQEIQDKILVAMATGVGAPDVGLIIESRFPSYPSTGGLADVTEHVAPREGDFSPRLRSRLKYRDRYFGLPYIQNAAVMFYRADYFAEKGYGGPIDTWPEWIEAGKRIRDKGRNIFMNQVSPGAVGFGPLVGYLESAGVQIFDEAGKTVKSNRKGAETLRFYFDLVRTHDISLLVTHNSPEHFVAIKEGRLAALHSGNWGLDRLETEAKADQGKWKVQAWPRWSKDAPAVTGTWGGSVLVIPRANRNQAAALKWANFLSSNVDGQVGLWQNGYGFPTSLKAQQDPRLRQPQSFLGQSMYEASLANREVNYLNLVPDWPRVQIEIGRQMDAMFQGQKTPEQAWSDFEAAMVRQYG